MLAGERPVEQRAVFRDDAVEDGGLGKEVEQLVELASGDEDQLASGALELLQRPQGLPVNLAVVGQGAVVVGGEGEKAHGLF